MNRLLTSALLLLLFVGGCYKDKNYDVSNLSASDVTVQMYQDSVELPADSFSVSRILVDLPYNADTTSAKTLVSYRTDLGFFVETGTQTAQIQAKQNVDSAKRIAIATLRSGTRIGTAHILISIFTQTRQLTMPFVNAYPDFIQFTASTLSVKPANDATGEASFTCRLFKYQGSPSQQNIVTLRVFDSAYVHTYGSFRIYNNESDGTGSTQFTYVLGDSTVNGVNYTGLLHAVISVARDNAGDSLSSTLTLVSSPVKN
jgi:hypothetical protein